MAKTSSPKSCDKPRVEPCARRILRAKWLTGPFVLLIHGLSVFPGSVAAAPSIELTASTFLPPSHGMVVDLMGEWAEQLNERTNGEVSVDIHAGGSAYGNIAKQLDQVRAGVTDIALGLHGIPRGRFPRTTIIDMPFLVRTSDAATRILMDLYPQFLAQEYQGLKVLLLFAHNAGAFHTREKPIRTAKDLKGLRIRAPSPATAAMLKYLGASPVGMPPGQVYENLQKGTLDGTIFAWDAIRAYKLYEVLDHHLEARAYTVSFYFVMNENTYDRLPENIRSIVDDISGAAQVPRIAALWNEWDEAARNTVIERGTQITQLPEAERSNWRTLLEPMIEDWLAGLEADGVDDAREIYAEAQRLAAQYERP